MYFLQTAIDSKSEEQQCDGNTIEEALLQLSERLSGDKKRLLPANDESAED